jgi:NADPH:quinone reductase-like Zn-dependent oxidoreductase
MKAFYSESYGAAEASHYGDYADPVVGPGQVLVEVKAVSINPVDYKVKRGDLRLLSGSKFPRILGSDFAGIVKEIGSGVTRFKSGDRVSGVASVIFGKTGALAQFLAINQKSIWTIPDEMNFEDAASLPVAALTALNGLRKCGVSKGTRVLINGGTGGVGHFAIQIAKAKGAFVTVTCSEANSELARKLGADETVGYTPESIAGLKVKFDAILDAFGHMKSGDIYRLLNRGKTYASTMLNPLVNLASPFIRLFRGKTITSANLRAKPEDITEIQTLFLEKKLQPVIEHYYTLEKSDEAFELAERGKPRGKIIIRIL